MPKRFSRELSRVSLLMVLMILFATADASAGFGIVPGSFTADTYKTDGTTPETQASTHPATATTSFALRTRELPPIFPGFPPIIVPDGLLKEVVVDLPAGFAGNPQAIPQCRPANFSLPTGFQCPAATQVGMVEVELSSGVSSVFRTFAPVYNISPGEDEAARFGFNVGVIVRIGITVRTDGDYGIRARIASVNNTLLLYSTRLTLWGVPASPDNDAFRGACLNSDGTSSGLCPSNLDPKPFLINPSSCGAPQTSHLEVISFDETPKSDRASYTAPNTVTGCDRLRFEPTIDVIPSSQRARSPAGLKVRIRVPQNDDPNGLATPSLRRAVVRLPEEMTISPSSADGLNGCTDAQMALRTNNEPTCPDGSKIGTVRIDTPLLSRPLAGEIYLGQPLKGQMFRIFLVVRGSGLLIKLPGAINPDPVTGQVTTVFEDNPPLPFSEFELTFKDGPRAPLTNPTTCGTKTASAELTAWGMSTPAQPTGSFQITTDAAGRPCAAQGFSPGFSAGMISPTAGASSTFTLTFARGDDDETLRDITVQMPTGLTGVIASTPLCPAGLAATGACPEASRIGSVTTGAGPGSNPFYLPGRVYLTDAYRGHPFGLSIVVPAIAGPFDLGTVVVRSSIAVSKTDASLRVVSDPLPTILEGVPLQIRTVNLRIDKPGFMINPTGCSSKRIAAIVNSTTGRAAAVGSRFSAADCGALRYTPRMSFKIGGRGHLRRENRTPFEAILSMPARQANNRIVEVTLPKMLNARLDVVSNRRACRPEQFSTDTCPPATQVGTAVAVTPLLRDPLRGGAYFVYNAGRRLPDLMVALRGQVAFDLRGTVTITRDLRLRTAFDTIPDVPVTRFALRLVGDRRNGPIGIVPANACVAAARGAAIADLSFRAHSGRLIRSGRAITVQGCGRAARRSASRGRRGGRSTRR